MSKLIKVLSPDAMVDYISFDESYSCSCHISPPCSKCTDPGNPLNLIEDDSAWIEINEDEFNKNPDDFETFENMFSKL